MDLSDPNDRAVLELFIRLETTPLRQRESRAFKEDEHQLARLLGLVDEWWTCNSVLDTSKKPPRPWLVAHSHWHRCRAVRKALLAAVEKLQQAAE